MVNGIENEVQPHFREAQLRSLHHGYLPGWMEWGEYIHHPPKERKPGSAPPSGFSCPFLWDESILIRPLTNRQTFRWPYRSRQRQTQGCQLFFVRCHLLNPPV